jgi:hypothetical protein
MIRWTAAVLFAGCLSSLFLAQTAPTQPTTAASPSAQTDFPLDKFKDFSAIMAGGPVGGTESEIHIYRSGNLMRMEANEGRSYQITDFDKQETHAVARSGCLRYGNLYIRSYPFSFSNPANKYEHVPGGKETVDGHVCQVEDVTVTLPTTPNPAKFRLWEAEDLQGFPIKIETKLHRVIQYKNVVLGPQDPTLFIFPTECQISEKTIGVKPAVAPKPKPAPAQTPKQ